MGLIQLGVVGYKVVMMKLKLLLRNQRSWWIVGVAQLLAAVSAQKKISILNVNDVGRLMNPVSCFLVLPKFK